MSYDLLTGQLKFATLIDEDRKATTFRIPDKPEADGDRRSTFGEVAKR